MTVGRSQQRYGRIAVGQRVQFDRVVLAPGCEHWGREAQVVTVRTQHVVTEIRQCDSGALVTLADSDGCQLRDCFNAYGQLWGGFGGLVLLQEAPAQLGLLRERANA